MRIRLPVIEGESGSGTKNWWRSPCTGRARADEALSGTELRRHLSKPRGGHAVRHARARSQEQAQHGLEYFEDARDGSLFLDEIGELPLELQAKLLRVLENGEYQRIGETQSRHSHARVIAATNRDLRQEVKAARFRADLYHRLSVFTVTVPPLRDLGEDKQRLLAHFAEFYAGQSGAAAKFTLDAR
jgi:DNA-binding NtrC family response regulator